MAEHEISVGKPIQVEVTNKSGGESSGWGNFANVLKTLLPAIGVFTALIYLLGRLYIESYYFSLGITPGVLTFTTQDYMFFSFDMVIMCLVFAGLFYLCWEWFIEGDTDKKGKSAVFYINQDNIEINTGALIFLLVVWVLSAAYNLGSYFNSGVYIKGFSGLCLGLVFGIGLIIVLIVIHYCRSWLANKKNTQLNMGFIVNLTKYKQKKTKSNPKQTDLSPGTPTTVSEKINPTSKKSFVIQSLVGVLILFSVMSWITENLAEIQAAHDVAGFPSVRVIATDNFSEAISVSSIQKDCLEGQILLTNNGITYVSVTYIIPKDANEKIVKYNIEYPVSSISSEKPKGDDNSIEYRQVYAIPAANIRDIVYIPDIEKLK